MRSKKKVIFTLLVTLGVAVGVFCLLWFWPPSQPGAHVPNSPPALLVTLDYPGANAQVLVDSIATPVEKQVQGLEKMVHMLSTSDNQGHYALEIIFEPDTDLEQAKARLQARMNLALPLLPDVVQRGGITIRKKSPGIFLIACLTSPNNQRDGLYLSSYARVQLQDELTRVPGVSDVVLFGQAPYQMVIYLNHEKLAATGLTAGEVFKTIQEQNVQVAAGQIGLPPVPGQKPVMVAGAGRLLTTRDLEQIIVKVRAEAPPVRLGDVAGIELGAPNSTHFAYAKGSPAVALCIYPTPESKPRELHDALMNRLAALRANLPEGLSLEVAFDFSSNLEPQRSGENLFLEVTLPDAASGERTQEVLRRCEAILQKVAGVDEILALAGPPLTTLTNQGCLFVRLAPPAAGKTGLKEIRQNIRSRLHDEIQEALIRVRESALPGRLPPRAFLPLDFALQGPDPTLLKEWAAHLEQTQDQAKEIADLGVVARPTPGFHLDIDRDKANSLGVSMIDIHQALQVAIGGLHLHDFGQFPHQWNLVLQLEKPDRQHPENLRTIKVPTKEGKLVPLGALVNFQEFVYPPFLERLDGQPMVRVTASQAAGIPLAQARQACKDLAAASRQAMRLPEEYRLVWLSSP